MQSEEYLSPLNTGEALVFVLGSDVKASEARISGLIDSLRERDARINQFTRGLAEAEEALAAADEAVLESAQVVRCVDTVQAGRCDVPFTHFSSLTRRDSCTLPEAPHACRPRRRAFTSPHSASPHACRKPVIAATCAWH